MDDSESIPFSSVVAGLLLCNRSVNAIDITNMISILSSFGIEVIDDDYSFLSVCIDNDRQYNFFMKEDMNYDTILDCGSSVYDFLESVAEDRFISILKDDYKYSNLFLNNYNLYKKSDDFIQNVNVKRRIRVPIFSIISGFK